MTVVESARRTAWKASRSDVLEVLTRLGFVGYGVLHLAVAYVAAEIAAGHPTADGDQTGAFLTLAHQPFGWLALSIVAVGLASMAVWQFLLGLVGHRMQSGFRRVFERVASMFRAVIYVFLAVTAVKIIAGVHSSAAQQQRELARKVLASAGGRVWIVIAGAAVMALGLGMIFYGLKKKFTKRLRVAQMHEKVRKLACWLGQTGYAARGTAVAVAGLLLAGTALSHEVDRAGGMDSALRTLANERFGGLLLGVVAAGFAAFGVYCFFQARYRRV